MRKTNLQSSDARYWTALFFASLVGTIFGDFVAVDLHLGSGTGAIPMMILFAIVLLIERRARLPSEAYYWIAIVATRTAATNLADLTTHTLEIPYPLVVACVVGLLVLTLFVGRPLKAMMLKVDGLPDINLRYWTAIVLASILGTASGDFVSEGLHFGYATGSLILGSLLAIVLVSKSRAKVQNEAYYWIAIVVLRSAGTTTGDFISNPEGLNLGFAGGALAMAVLLLGVLNFRRMGALLFRAKSAA